MKRHRALWRFASLVLAALVMNGCIALPGKKRYGIFVVNVDGTGLRRVATTETFEGYFRFAPNQSASPYRLAWNRFSPDESLARTGIVTGRLDLNTFQLTPEHVLPSRLFSNNPCWSPDGKLLAFFALNQEDRPPHSDVFAWEPGSPTTRPLAHTPDRSEFDPEWHSSGATVLPVTVLGQGPKVNRLFLSRDWETGAGRFITTPPADDTFSRGFNYGDFDPKFSPDGQTIIWMRKKPAGGDQPPRWQNNHGLGVYHIFTYDVGRGVEREWPAPEGFPAEMERTESYPSFSPDGKQVVFFRIGMKAPVLGYQIVLASSDGTNQRVLPIDSRLEPQHAVFTPDGQHLLFSTKERQPRD